jgi:predicted TIM-barrel fold metal-dependent hydrolase
MSAKGAIVDVNVWLGSWPFQYFRDDSARKLERLLEHEGIAHALVGSPEAAFNPDCSAANRMLEKRVAGSRRLHPVPAMNPTMGDWRDILDRSRGDGRMAIRLFPTYHVYGLDSGEALTAIEQIARSGELSLFLQMRMEDERTHHPLCRIPGLSTAAIVAVARRFPELSIVALCPYYHEAVELAKETSSVRVDLSYVETMRTLASLLDTVAPERVLFGSHAPFLYPRAAVMKLEAPYVPEPARRAIGRENARAILRRRLPGTR